MTRPAGTYVDLATSVITAHQWYRGGCLCGWGSSATELGESWSRHVAEVLAQAGALQVPPAYRKETP